MGKRPFYSFSDRIPKGAKEDYFFDTTGFEWVELIEKNFSVIKSEIMAHIDSGNAEIKPYFANEMMNEPGKWKTFTFYFWGIDGSPKAIEECPKTVSLFKSIDGIVSFSVSMMEPHGEIKPHRGDTDAVYRCHLGLEIPAALPECGFYVGYEERSWHEGKIFVFNDAAYHKGWNKTDKRRIILSFDVLRPQYSNNKSWICSRIYASLYFAMLNQKLKLLRPSEFFMRRSICLFFAFPIYFSMKTGILKKTLTQLFIKAQG